MARWLRWMAGFAVLLAACGGWTPTAPTTGATGTETGPAPIASGERYLVAAPVTHGALTLFPVLDTRAKARPALAVQTLSEGLLAGTLTVSEVDDSGTVPTLLVHNTGAEPVLLMVGDVVQGGKQDRVLTEDVLVEPSAEPVKVAVNCVEQGRWQDGRTHFAAGGTAEVDLKRTLQMEQDQSKTWSKVAELNASKADKLRSRGLAAASETLAPSSGTYMASLDNDHVREETAATLAAVKPALTDGKVVGVVVALGGEIHGAELFGHPALFRKAEDGLLNGFALDAVSKETAAAVPTQADASAFLAAALAAPVEETRNESALQKVVRDAPATKAFESRSEAGELLHLNTWKK